MFWRLPNQVSCTCELIFISLPLKIDCLKQLQHVIHFRTHDIGHCDHGVKHGIQRYSQRLQLTADPRIDHVARGAFPQEVVTNLLREIFLCCPILQFPPPLSMLLFKEFLLRLQAQSPVQEVQPTEDLAVQDAETPDVCWKRRVRLLKHHFRGQERERATATTDLFRTAALNRNIKVYELENDVCRCFLDTNVLGFDVAMSNITGMQMCHCQSTLLDETTSF
mmetsp:Transcript_105409/g.186245  ORF Transcript_105409/g.186245 Transcript_105409/m.186245 type:complete len:222 (+) Transcript_105409:238-903(+)